MAVVCMHGQMGRCTMVNLLTTSKYARALSTDRHAALSRLTGNGEYTDNSGHTWTGEFNERTANNLRLKLC